MLVGEMPPPLFSEMASGILSGTFGYLAHVHNRSHFVLLTGIEYAYPDTFTVNDPDYNVTTYAWETIADVIVYKIYDEPPSQYIPTSFPLFKQCDPVRFFF